MSEYGKNFNKQFIIRTRKIIESSSKQEYPFTLLLNCSLSLICLPMERYKHMNDKNEKICKLFIEEMRNIEIEIVQDEQYEFDIFNTTMMRCFRNGLAHIDMKNIDSREVFQNVQITGTTKQSNKKVQLIFTLNYDQLKQLAIFISNTLIDDY